MGSGPDQGRRDPEEERGTRWPHTPAGAMAASGSQVPRTHSHPRYLFQFDLQRIVIYCDSRHAELETCCDIPLGPVSRACMLGGEGELRGTGVSGAWEPASRAGRCPPSECGLRRFCFLGTRGVGWGSGKPPGAAVVLASVSTPRLQAQWWGPAAGRRDTGWQLGRGGTDPCSAEGGAQGWLAGAAAACRQDQNSPPDSTGRSAPPCQDLSTSAPFQGSLPLQPL